MTTVGWHNVAVNYVSVKKVTVCTTALSLKYTELTTNRLHFVFMGIIRS